MPRPPAIGAAGQRRRFGQLPTSAGADVAAIVAQLCGSSPNYCTWQSGANKRGALQAFWTQAVQSRYLPDPSSSVAEGIFDASFSCSQGYSAAGSSAAAAGRAGALTQTGTKTAAGILSASPAAGPLAPIVAGIGAIVGLVTGIFAKHHAAAVAGEAADICGAVPQVNAVLQQIDAGLSAGTITPAQAQAMYAQLQAPFTQALHQNTTFKTGDTLWAYSQALVGVIEARNQDLASGVSSAGTGAAIGGIPAWVWIAGAAALLFL